MKYILLIVIFLLVTLEKQMAQEIDDPISYIPWKQVVLNNHATFKSRNDLDWGSGFLINYKDGIIACTARDFTGTIINNGILIKDFDKELNSWKMCVSDDPSQFVTMDSLILKGRIEKSFSIFYMSMSFLTFSIKQTNDNLIPLDPDIRRIMNKDTLYLVGYDYEHNLKIVQGIVETTSNEKYSEPEIRVKTNVYLNYANFVGAPIVDKNGKAVGIVNRAYRLNKTKKGRIINENKIVEGSHFEYFVNGTSMRSVLGKDYDKSH